LNCAIVPVSVLLDRFIVLLVRASELDIVGTVTQPACTLPVPLGTRFILIFALAPVAVSDIVPVPPTS
jgi:hypothetical protein